MEKQPPKILITGANGQIGSVLSQSLRTIYGHDQVIVSDIQETDENRRPFCFLDILNVTRLKEILQDYEITEIYHLAAILSANGEWNPMKTWNVNLNGYLSLLELAKELPSIQKIFFPSTIAVFGLTTPRKITPQHTVLEPTTVYGMSKASGELWSKYYYDRYGLDVRSRRYPGIIGYQSMPGGGTTDYAVEIFHEALKHGKYECFLQPSTKLPMMYMEDAIRATIELMQAPAEQVRIRTGYNLAAMSFTPAEIAASIQRHIPDLQVIYKPDHRQAIAESWTESIDDSAAQKDWGWRPNYDLDKMTDVMIEKLKPLY